MDKVFMIAEAGVNHNGDVMIAKKLIDAAKDAGADAVKFQTFKAEKLVTINAPKAKYQIENTGENGAQFEMLKKLELTTDGYKGLFSYCKEREIIFLSTPFDEGSADMLDELGMNIYKVPSGEVTNKSLIQHIASKGKNIILSTGMSYLGEIEKAVYWIIEIWDRINARPSLTLLHCVSNYPASVDDVNLRAMKTMEKSFSLPVGYSDHTTGCEVSIAAVAMGARVIEKHFTLSKSMKGPDHQASLEPDELKDMISAVRNIEKAMGNGIKKPADSEKENAMLARKSIVAAKEIEKGNILSLENVAIKRPGTGISACYLDEVIGREAKRNFQADELIEV